MSASIPTDPAGAVDQALTATESLVQYLNRLTDFFFAGMSPANAIMQLGSILAAVLIAFFVSRFFGARLLAMKVHLTEKTFAHHAGRLTLAVVNSLLFSVTAASILALCVLILTSVGLAAENANLLFVRLAYQIFYAWAMLYLTMRLLEMLFGEKLFGPSAQRSIATVFWILAVLQIVGILPEIVNLMKTYTLPIGSDKLTVWTLFVGLVTVVLTLGVANKLADVCEKGILRMQELEMNLRVVFARICRVSFLVVGLLIALSTVGIDLTILSVFGGAVGVGIGFGMQKIASNYISGFIILFDRSVKLGDLVEVGGFSGVVTQINTRYSVLRNTAGEELIVPNENFVTGSVKNYSLTERDCVVTVEVSCAYEADVDRALEILAQCVKEQPRVIARREPWCIVSSFGASGINLKAGFWVADPQNGTGGLKSNIMRAVLKRYQEAGIEIPYDKLEVTLKGAQA